MPPCVQIGRFPENPWPSSRVHYATISRREFRVQGIHVALDLRLRKVTHGPHSERIAALLIFIETISNRLMVSLQCIHIPLDHHWIFTINENPSV